VQAILTNANDVQQEITSLTQELGAAQAANADLQKQVADLTMHLKAVTADDQSVAAQLLLAQKRIGYIAQLAKPSMEQNLHRLPFTQDPNWRAPGTWFQPGNTGNTGGGSAAKHGTWSVTQNSDGSTEFAITPAGPFDDFIWGLNFFQGTAKVHNIIQVTEFELKDEFVSSAMAIETNMEHSIGGFRFNAGLQALLGWDKDAISGQLVSGQWRYFDIGVGHWLDTGIPFDRTMFGTGKRIELVSEFAQSDDPAQGMENVSLTINGVPHAIGKWTKAKATTWGPYLQQGFQMDSLQSAAPFKVNVWNMETYWL
jgi:hypothetical protein